LLSVATDYKQWTTNKYMKFVDEAEITVKSGDGGAGCVKF